MTSARVRSSLWRGTGGWTSALKGLCSLPNIDLLCCCVGAWIICKQYPPWSRGLLVFFFLCRASIPCYPPPFCCLSVLSRSLSLCSYIAMFGSRRPSPNCLPWPEPYEFAYYLSLPHVINVHVWENCHFITGGGAAGFVRFLLLSLLPAPAIHEWFPLWASVLIADGVVLAKYLVTVLKGWKMVNSGGRLEESPFCFVLPLASWVHNESLQALSFSC